MKKKAFTLAEVMITILILGIIAVITIPTLMHDVHEKVYERSASVFNRRLGEALKVMNLHGNLADFENTEAFVEELSKNLRINKICDSDHLTDCFTTNIKMGDEEDATKIKAKNLTTVNKLNPSKNYGDTETIGVVFDSGVTALIGYNLYVEQDPYNNELIKVVGDGDVTGSVTVTTDALAILYDVDGKGGADVYGKDIRGININLSASGCIGTTRTIDGQKYCDLGTTYDALDCSDESNNAVYAYCSAGRTAGDYWAGARQACANMGMSLPTVSELQALQGKTGAPRDGAYWSSSEDSSVYVSCWHFSGGYKDGHLKTNKYSVLCSGD